MPFDESSPELQELGYLLAEASRNVIFVIGAGLSQPAGLPGWVGLNKALMEEAQNKIMHDLISADEKAARLKQLSDIVDPWVLGDALWKTIPHDRYIGRVRRELSASLQPPATYKAIWKLNPSGVVSFNLDRLAADSLGGTAEQVATAIEPLKYHRFLLLNRPFLFQPHGALATPDSWVLGLRARNTLLRKNRTYREWMSHVLAGRRLVIIGFRPRDFSFESLLLDDMRATLESRPVDHFWLAPDPDYETRQWAEQYNLKIIPYTPSDSSHREVLEILKHLATFRPRNPTTGVAYQGPAIGVSDLPPDDELRRYDVQDIRKRLNAALRGGTESIPDHDGQLQFMADFIARFSGSVHMAWHIGPAPYDIVWGYQIVSELGKGGFGNVWRVVDVVDGSTYAMKVLHETTVTQAGFLEAFRRGVRAMKILSEANVAGMVKYVGAFDIPACVVMEFVEGMNFEEAMKAEKIETLADALDVVFEVGNIVRRGHELDRQVLHRDLKPANVMIRNVDSDEFSRDIVVLDFDLSWYEGAMGRSVMQGSRLHNYIAPEQIERRPGVSSRHTGVDVFGLGMLLYYASTGRHPAINVQNTNGFRPATSELIESCWNVDFVGVPRYLSLVIAAAANDEQSDRPSLPLVVEQIELVRKVVRDHLLETPSDLANLEIVERLLRDGWGVTWTT